MAKLSSSQRNSLPASQFAEPGKRAYPINDLNHARNALSRVSQYGSPAEQKQVRAAVAEKYPQLAARRDALVRRATGKK